MSVQEFSCGACLHFDTRDIKGKLFGDIKMKQPASDGTVTIAEHPLGVCRTRGGLVFGIRPDTSRCAQPPGVFTPVTNT